METDTHRMVPPWIETILCLLLLVWFIWFLGKIVGIGITF